MWRCSLAFLVPLSVLQQGFPIEITGEIHVSFVSKGTDLWAGNRFKDTRSSIVEVSVMEDGFWDFFSFLNLRDFLFLDWARAIFLFSISEPICDKLVLNRKQMVPFSKSNVCVCHSTASFMIHSLSLPFLSLSFSLSLSLFSDLSLTGLYFPQYVLYLSLCLFSVHLVVFLCLTGLSGFSCLCFWRALLQSLVVLFTVNKSSSSAQKLMDQQLNILHGLFQICEDQALKCYFQKTLLILRLDENTLTALDEWSLFQVSFLSFKKSVSPLCSYTEDQYWHYFYFSITFSL